MLDFETASIQAVTILASDGEMAASIIINITITDVNEPPDFDNLPGTASVAESENTTVELFTVSGRDVDADDVLSYAIVNTEPANGPFSIESTTGKMYYITV